MITVSTDGSALGNPNGPMGWAWADHAPHAARTPGHSHDGDCDAGGATNGTNQIGELVAVLEALRAHPGDEPLTIETDSQYAINCSTKWVKGWKKNGWKNSQKKPVKNAPLIKAIDAEIAQREGPVKFVWVKGHNGNPGNEKVDDLAHTYSGDARSGVRDGYLPLEGWQSLLASDYARGVDIPADAQLLIDGEITNEEYHLGRGEQSSPNFETERPTSAGSNTNTDNSTDTDNSGDHTRRTSRALQDLLNEPEGVADYDFGQSHAGQPSGSALNDGDATKSSNVPVASAAPTVSATSTVSAASAASTVPDVSTAPDIAATSTVPATPTATDENQPPASPQGSASNRASGAQAPANMTASGLTISGTLQVSPPPSSSPTYTGQPRHLHGFVEVDALVEGDGTVMLQSSPFFIATR